ncbi:MAG: F0F1 ATP synthase subunit B [Chroococcus sp. CMT-3BRIN-NPC107]|jgi:F-type H+-transporting ATPase subunit b|nr:F0F1 ATP synthase subunit B [Chroococcus sp. CMT-3BRIN-NPC107]
MNIIGSYLLTVAAEAGTAHAEAEGGFGLNLDIFETNIINLAILVGVLFYFGRGLLTNILTERKAGIATEIQAAEKSATEAAAALSEAQKNLTQAQAEAQRIQKTAVENAQAAKEAILAQAAKDVEQMKQMAAQDLNTETDRAIADLRQQVVAKALQKVESQLRHQVDGNAEQKLLDRSITLLGSEA